MVVLVVLVVLVVVVMELCSSVANEVSENK
jgi:hypothetical protein